MRINYIPWILFGLILIVSLGLAFYGWQLFRQANVIVEWSTASELDTVGFYVYRGETPEGPFTRLTSELIPSSADPLVGGNYSYVDRTVSPGRKYFYILEDVSDSGATGRHGPIEVVAQSGGVIELSLAAVLLVVAFLGIRTARRPASTGLEAK